MTRGPPTSSGRREGGVPQHAAAGLVFPSAKGFTAGQDGDPAEEDADADEGPAGPPETALDGATVVALVGVIVAVLGGLIARGTCR